MKYRSQRGGFAESMAEVVECEPNLFSLETAIAKTLPLPQVFGPLRNFSFKVTPYCYDDRNGWNTYVVTVDGQAVGFTDGPCTENG